MNLPPKASSVTADGKPDDFVPPTAWRVDVERDGRTRLVLSCAPERLESLYFELLALLDGPIGVMYVQLTDRRAGQHHQGKPRRFVGVDRPLPRVVATLRRCPELLFRDGRHQLWLRGKFGEQLVLDELGMIYLYPDDPAFRERLEALGVPGQDKLKTMAERDYVRVEMQAIADPQEAILLAELSLQPVAEPGA